MQVGRESAIFNDEHLIGLLLDRNNDSLSIYVHGRLRCTVPNIPAWGPLYPAVCVLDENQSHEIVPLDFDVRSAPRMEIGSRRVVHRHRPPHGRCLSAWRMRRHAFGSLPRRAALVNRPAAGVRHR